MEANKKPRIETIDDRGRSLVERQLIKEVF